MNLQHLFTKEAIFLDAILSHNDINMRMVGGAVRDALLGVTPKDLDFAVDQPPERVTEVLEAGGVHVIPTGLQHGTITAVINGEAFELTTLRVDVETNGRHADVEWTSDFELDASRRDFTINAMSVDPNGNLFDYFGGKLDLKRGVVRFIGDADARVREDYLRILRFFRFQQRLGSGVVDQDAMDAIFNNVAGLKNISGERIWMELSKILPGSNTVDTVMMMHDVGVFDVIGIPGFKVNDVLQAVSERSTNPITILAAGCTSVMSSVEATNTIENHWKVTSNERDLFRFITNNTVGKMNSSKTDWDATLITMAVRPKANNEFVRELALFIGSELFEHWDVPVFPVRGQDLLDNGMTPGKEVGERLKKMRRYWIESNFQMDNKTLLDLT